MISLGHETFLLREWRHAQKASARACALACTQIGSRQHVIPEIEYVLLVGTLVSVSTVISTYTTERLHDVVRCISSLKRQTLPPAEIILVLDPRKELVEFYKSHVPSEVKMIVSNDVGLSHARNTGVKNAKGEIVAFIDDDATANEKWL